MSNIKDREFDKFTTIDGSTVVKVVTLNPVTITLDGGLDFSGDYNSATNYVIGDLVSFNGSSYVAIQNTINNDPTDQAFWQLIADKGADGNDGADGPQGIQGPQGADGADGVGVPIGGTLGQVLAKASVTDYDTEWITPASGGGAVDSVNGQTGTVVLDKTHIGLGNVDNISDANKAVSIATQAELDLKQPNLTGFDTALFYQVTAGDIQAVPNWSINSLQGLTQTPAITVTAGFGESINNWIAAIDHDVVSLDKNYQMHYNRINTDVTDTGNAVGTNGRYVSFISNDFFHDKESDIGEVAFTTNSFELGLNGALPIDVNGWSYAYGFGQVRNNVTIKNVMQGYGFQPFFENGSLVDVNANLTAFYDFTNAPNTVFGFYTGINLSPIIGGIQNNRNMQSININPTTGDLLGNAGYQGLGLFGTFGDIGTNGYQGINISPTIGLVENANLINVNPTITSSTNVVGLDINMNNVTGTNVLAARFTGDVQINGTLNFSGNLSTGKFNCFAAENFFDGGFVPSNVHSLVSSLNAANAVTTANADHSGVNVVTLSNFAEDSVTTSGPFGIGATALLSPLVITMEPNSTVQHARGAMFALSLDAGGTGGTIQNLVGCRSVAIPNGVTTVNKFIAYEADLPFGDVTSGDSFGFFSSAEVHNYFRGSVCLGGTQEKVTNSSVGLEVASTTKAILNSRMTTAERDALTPIDGMQIYNTTLNVLQTRSGGTWANASTQNIIEGFLGASNFTTTLDTLQDTGISFALGSNEEWSFEMNLQNGCNNTGGLKYAIALPAGATIRAVINSITSGNTAYTSQVISSTAEIAINLNTVNSQGGWARIVGKITTTATTGNAVLQMRANVAGQTVTLHKESHYKATRLV